MSELEQNPFREPVAGAVWWACITELKAFKPGNVSIHSEGHGMRVADFVTSARCIAPILGQADLSVGERILQSIQATRAAVECNTNLGIVLLCAPITHSVLLSVAAERPFRACLSETLVQLDIQDAERVFQAIRLAKPAGLGNSTTHDVNKQARADLYTVMRAAQTRDRIAYQYSNDFVDVFDGGVPILRQALERWPDIVWATVELYLHFLAKFADTHIQRKLGDATAEAVRCESVRLLDAIQINAQPERIRDCLSDFDIRLKQRGINPGTSADLTVATLLVYRLQKLLQANNLTPGVSCGKPVNSEPRAHA